MPPMMKLRLKEIRRLRGLSLEEAASGAGVSNSTFQRWENGTTSIPSDRLADISRVLDCRISDLFDDAGCGRAPVFPPDFVGDVAPPPGYLLISDDYLIEVLATVLGPSPAQNTGPAARKRLPPSDPKKIVQAVRSFVEFLGSSIHDPHLRRAYLGGLSHAIDREEPHTGPNAPRT